MDQTTSHTYLEPSQSAAVVYWNYYDALNRGLIAAISVTVALAQLIDGTVLAFGSQSLAAATGTSLDGYVYRWNMTSVTSNNNWNDRNHMESHQLPIPPTGGIQTVGTANTYRGPSIFAVSSDDSVIVVGT